ENGASGKSSGKPTNHAWFPKGWKFLTGSFALDARRNGLGFDQPVMMGYQCSNFLRRIVGRVDGQTHSRGKLRQKIELMEEISKILFAREFALLLSGLDRNSSGEFFSAAI